MSKYLYEDLYQKAAKEYISDDTTTFKYLSDKYGFDIRCFKTYMKKHNIIFKLRNKSRKYLIKEKEVVEIFKAGNDIPTKIAKIVGLSEQTVSKILKKKFNFKSIHGKIQKEQYTIDQTFFDDINTEEKAYWLGFIFADGSIKISSEHSKGLSIELSSIDKQHLEKFKNSINSNAPIRHRKNRNISLITVFNLHLVNKLIDMGCVKNKTINGNIPINLLIKDKKYIKGFLRGFCDGDGYIDKKRYRIVYTIKSKLVANQICLLLNELNISFNIKENHHRYFRVYCENKINFFKFLTAVYKNSDIYLDRKYAIYKNRISSRPESTATEDSGS